MGDDERIAPVIPLFGGVAGARSSRAPRESGEGDETGPVSDPESIVPRRTGDAGLWRSTWDGLGDDDHADRASDAASPGVDADLASPRDGRTHPSRRAAERTTPRLRALRTDNDSDPAGVAIDPDELRTSAEELLVRKLRSKSLSVSEAKTVLRGFEQEGQRVSAEQIEDIVDDYCRRGYLDDATLAWHLVTSGVERKGQGRVMLSRALAQRGIPRTVIEEALAEVPDDDDERALEFARSKARAMSGLDADTALRRLVGQLARRGYNGSVAMTAAKTALRESTFGRPSSGVRFVDSD